MAKKNLAKKKLADKPKSQLAPKTDRQKSSKTSAISVKSSSKEVYKSFFSKKRQASSAAKKASLQPISRIRPEGTRIAKIIADAGFCSRRQAEELIEQGRVQVNGQFIESPAVFITDQSIKIDGKLLGGKQKMRLFLFHKPAGFICTNDDPESRRTIFSLLPQNLPRLIAVGRLDFNSEGLLLLTTNGEVARYIELPKNAWIRKYRVRVFGKLNHQRLAALSKGIQIDNVKYGAIQVKIEVEKPSNSWLEVSLTEGKNREIRKIMSELGLTVNRLIRIGFGPFNLSKLGVGEVIEVKKSSLISSLPQELISQT